MPKQRWQRQFYRSKAWRKVRALVIQRDGGVCGYCGAHILDTPVVHHKVELTEKNVNQTAISLNPDLLMAIHEECHNKVHEKLKPKEKRVIINDDLSIDYSRRMEVIKNCISKQGSMR